MAEHCEHCRVADAELACLREACEAAYREIIGTLGPHTDRTCQCCVCRVRRILWAARYGDAAEAAQKNGLDT